MKKKVIFISLFILLICCYFGYKGFNLYYYDINNMTDEYEDYIKGLTIKDTITLKQQPLDNYIEFNGIKVKNEFEDFEKLGAPQSTEDSVKYVLYDKKRKVVASFWISTADTYVNILKSDKTLFGTGDKRVTNDNLTDLLEKNKINNDIELFKYLEKQKNTKNNIFTSVRKMKENYTLHFMVAVMLPSMDNISLIDGDYNGYIFNLKNNMKEVNILKNGKRYVFMFMNTDYFTDEYIEEILNSIEINN